MEPAQPATRAVCMRCTASNRPGSLMTTVCTRYQGNPMGVVLGGLGDRKGRSGRCALQVTDRNGLAQNEDLCKKVSCP